MSRVFGCMQRGCPSGSYCDEATGYCAVLACSEGCPRGASCNHANGKCESGVPAAARGHEYQQPYGDAQDGRGRGLWREPPP